MATLVGHPNAIFDDIHAHVSTFFENQLSNGLTDGLVCTVTTVTVEDASEGSPLYVKLRRWWSQQMIEERVDLKTNKLLRGM
jgi:hypothetical protein